jgi:hypothetical protein
MNGRTLAGNVAIGTANRKGVILPGLNLCKLRDACCSNSFWQDAPIYP